MFKAGPKYKAKVLKAYRDYRRRMDRANATMDKRPRKGPLKTPSIFHYLTEYWYFQIPWMRPYCGNFMFPDGCIPFVSEPVLRD